MDLKEASLKAGLAERTLYRYLERGMLKAEKVGAGPGTRWDIEEEDLAAFLANRTGKATQGKANEGKSDNSVGHPDLYQTLREMIEALKTQVIGLEEQLEVKDGQITQKDRQIEQLHILLQQSQNALPAPKSRRRWRLWGRA